MIKTALAAIVAWGLSAVLALAQTATAPPTYTTPTGQNAQPYPNALIGLDSVTGARCFVGTVATCQIPSNSAPYAFTPLGYQQITSLSASTALTIPTGASVAVITIETQAVRYRDDGVAPTGSVGWPIAVGQPVPFYGAAEIAALRFIEQTASAKIDVNYYK